MNADKRTQYFGRGKFQAKMEIEYQLDLADEKVDLAKKTSWMAITLYAAFGILDIFAAPTNFEKLWLIRASVILIILCLLAFIYIFHDEFLELYSFCIASEFLTLALGIILIISKLSSQDDAFHTYYGGLFLVVIGLFTWTYLSPAVATSIGLLIVYCYFEVTLQRQFITSKSELSTNVINCTFLCAANFIGSYGLFMREKYSRMSYYLKQQLVESAMRDGLTGLHNRRYFWEVAKDVFRSCRRQGIHPCLAVLDIDHFKNVNDTYGHAAGDAVLCALSQIIKAKFRSSDIICRYGGEEFVLLLVGGTLTSTKFILDELIVQFRDTRVPVVNGFISEMTFSAGVIEVKTPDTNIEIALHLADDCLYRAKSSGKACVVVDSY